MKEDKDQTPTRDEPENRHYDVVHVEGPIQQSYQPPNNSKETERPDDDSDGHSEYKPPWPIRLHLGWKEHRTANASIITTLISLVALAVIIMQSVIYVRQTDIMAQTFEEGRKTRELENRAYVGASHVRYQPIEGPVDESRILVKLTNTGRTPAVGRAMSLLVFTPERQLPDDFMVADPAYNFARMGPSQEVFLPGEALSLDAGTIPTFNLKEGPKERRDYKIKTPFVSFNPRNLPYGDDARLFVVGVIEYQDFFNVKRTTVFCYVTDKRRVDVFVLCGNLNHFN